MSYCFIIYKDILDVYQSDIEIAKNYRIIEDEKNEVVFLTITSFNNIDDHIINKISYEILADYDPTGYSIAGVFIIIRDCGYDMNFTLKLKKGLGDVDIITIL